MKRKRTIKEILEKRRKKIEHSKEALIGKIIGVHGLKGEVKVKPESEIFLRQINETKELTGYRGTARKTLTVESVREKDDIFIVKFKESKDRTEAENLLKTELYIDREKLIPLEEGEFFFEDLVGCKVITESGETVGEVTHILEMPASEILVVKKGEKEILIPFISQFVKKVNTEKKEIIISPIEGLI